MRKKSGNRQRYPSKAYRTYLFKRRMIEIICLILRDNAIKCYFCGKIFKSSDFPISGRDLLDIHHVTYVPEYKVLAHHKCHLKHHKEQRKLSKLRGTK